MQDPLTIYINCARIIARRDWERDKLNMPLEIKGLGAAVASARKGIAEVRAASADVNESARGLTGDLVDLKKQIDTARDDLKFEAQTLGNSQAADEKLSPPSQNGAGNGGEPVLITRVAFPESNSAGPVNHLDRNGVNKG